MRRGGGGGTVSPCVAEPHEYRVGDIANLSAFGNDEWIFDHWSGDLEEDDDPDNPMQGVELTASKSLTAGDGPAPGASGGRKFHPWPMPRL